MHTQTKFGNFQKQLRDIAPTIGDTMVLKTLSVVNGAMCNTNNWTPIDVRINHRAKRYSRTTASGHLYLYVWSRDCDCVEAGHVQRIKASEFENFEKSFYEHLEGPGYIRVITKEEYLAHEDEIPRDRILEAFENGRNYFV